MKIIFWLHCTSCNRYFISYVLRITVDVSSDLLFFLQRSKTDQRGSFSKAAFAGFFPRALVTYVHFVAFSKRLITDLSLKKQVRYSQHDNYTSKIFNYMVTVPKNIYSCLIFKKKYKTQFFYVEIV